MQKAFTINQLDSYNNKPHQSNSCCTDVSEKNYSDLFQTYVQLLILA